MGNYEEARVKLINDWLKKLDSTAANKIGKTLRITKKNFRVEELPHELLVKTRRKTKIQNVFVNNMLMDIKLSIAQLSKIILLGGFLGALLGKFGGPLVKVAVPLARDLLAPLSPMASASAIDGAIQRAMHGRGVVRAGILLSLWSF